MSANFYELMLYAKTGIASPGMTAYDKMRAIAMTGAKYPVQTITGVPPISFLADGRPLDNVTIIGNRQQTGTPTPDAPIMPDFCGKLVGTNWAIPITCGAQTVTADLSQVQTTRRIRKLVLMGEETIYSVTQNIAQNAYCFTYRYADLGMSDIINYNEYVNTIPYPEYICTHFKMRTTPTTQVTYNDLAPGEIGANSWARTQVGWRNQYLVLCTDFCSTKDELKQYLASEYSAAHPVTIWYVMEEPQAAIVNEPLAKIGTYADTLDSTDAGIVISTVRGSNTLSVGTTVQPSSVTITGHIKPL